jgi:hypothetical protein
VVGNWAQLTRSYGDAHGEHPLLCLTAGSALRLSREAQSAAAGACLDWADTFPRGVCPICVGVDGSRIKLERRTLPLKSQSYLSTLGGAEPNKPAAPNPAIASQLHVGRHWRGVGEPDRSPAPRAP